jgi:redox-sensitive bicupin YhaK (pirin superfamily)
MVQLWVNLPAKDKMAPPKYQPILSADIPAVALAGGAGTLRVIAGSYAGKAGPASTFTPLHVWDMQLNGGADVELPAANGWNTALVVLRGAVHVNRSASARDAQLVLLDPNGTNLSVEAKDDAVLLLLSGQPIKEPVAGHGPFVMNTQAEIVQAIEDYNTGRFGQIAHQINY